MSRTDDSKVKIVALKVLHDQLFSQIEALSIKLQPLPILHPAVGAGASAVVAPSATSAHFMASFMTAATSAADQAGKAFRQAAADARTLAAEVLRTPEERVAAESAVLDAKKLAEEKEAAERSVLADLKAANEVAISVVAASIRSYLLDGERVIHRVAGRDIMADERADIAALSDEAWQAEARRVMDCIKEKHLGFTPATRASLLHSIPRVRPLSHHRSAVVRAAVGPRRLSALPPAGAASGFDAALPVAAALPSLAQRRQARVSSVVTPSPLSSVSATPELSSLSPSAQDELHALFVAAEDVFGGHHPGLAASSMATPPLLISALAQQAPDVALVAGIGGDSVAATSNSAAPAPAIVWDGAQLRQALKVDELKSSLQHDTWFSWFFRGRRVAKREFLNNLDQALNSISVREAIHALMRDLAGKPPAFMLVVAGCCSRVAGIVRALEKRLQQEGPNDPAQTSGTFHP